MKFLDSSAIVKLVLDEPESQQLTDYLRGERFVTSALSRTEVIRAVARRSESRLPLAILVIESASMLQVTDAVLRSACSVAPTALRTLDAIHLASALELRGELTAFVAYDARLLEAASAMGLPTASPGRR